MAKKEVFISYKSEDFETAEWVRSVLETNGISCWMAPADIPGGSSYAVEIPTAISNCRILVVVLSRKAQESTWVPKELDRALNSGKTIMPFMTENFPLRDDFNFYLSNVQRYAAYEDKSRAMEKMVREIQAVLQIEPQKIEGKPIVLSDENPGRRKRKRLAVLCCILLLMAGIITGVWLALRSKLNDQSENTAEIKVGTEPEATESTEVEITAEAVSETANADADATETPDVSEKENEVYHFTLKPDGELTGNQIEDDREKIKERLKILADGREYDPPKDVGLGLDVYMPKAAFDGYPLEYIINNYIIRAVKLCLMDTYDIHNRIDINGSDLESIELKAGAIPDVDVSEYGITDDEYWYIEIKLSDSFVAAHQEEYSSWLRPMFSLDYYETIQYEGYLFDTISAGDGKTFYCLSPEKDKKYYDLLENNLKKPLAENFTCVLDLNLNAEWEDPDHAEQKGKNQCAYEGFDTGTVTFSYWIGETKAGDLINAMNCLKTRLDALDIPYAVGTMGKGSTETRIVIKTLLKHMGLPVMRLLSERNDAYLQAYTIRSNRKDINWSYFDFAEKRGPEYGFDITRRYNYSYDPQELAQIALEKGEETMYIYLKQSLPGFAFSASETAQTGKISVTDLCMVENGRIRQIPIGADNLWYARLIKTIITTKLPQGIFLDTQLMNVAPDGTLPDEADYEISDVFDCIEIETAVREITPEAVVSYDKTGFQVNILIQIRLSPDNDFLQNAMGTVQKIYERLDPENLQVASIKFELSEQGSDSNDNISVTFGREKTRENEKYTEIYNNCFVMTSGKMNEKYYDELNMLTKNSDFYQSFAGYY